MKIKILFLVFLAFLFHAGSVDAQKRRPVPKPRVLSAREIAAKVLPSVVLIITQDENGQPIAQGSGFVYKPGLVVSNLHVFERATNAIIKDVKTGEISKAIEVVGISAQQDICVIRIDSFKFTPLSIGNSFDVNTGDEVYVASNPKGLEGSFTKGIISAIRTKRSINTLKKTDFSKGEQIDFDKFVAEWRDTVFQIDAAISSGSSGGPVLSSNGKVIGIVKSTVVGGQNLNFVIPIQLLLDLALRFNHSIQLAGACAYSDRKKEGLVGNVKSLREKELPKKAGSSVPVGNDLISTSLKVFGVNGDLVEWTLFDASTGAFGIKYQYKYDESGLVESSIATYSSAQVKSTTYDLEGAIRFKLALRDFSGNFGTVDGPGGLRIFDSDGNLITWYLSGSTQKFAYDDHGRAIEKSQLQSGNIERVTRYEYVTDSHGNWIKQLCFARFPNSAGVDPNRWFEEESYYREVTYYE